MLQEWNLESDTEKGIRKGTWWYKSIDNVHPLSTVFEIWVLHTTGTKT